jgi:hypothetical protein
MTHTISVTEKFDYAFAENGLTAYKLGKQLSSQSFIKFLGEDKYKLLVKYILHYVADLDIPIKRYANQYTRSLYTRLIYSQFKWHVPRVPQRDDQRQPDWPKCDVSGRNRSSKASVGPNTSSCSIQERKEFEIFDLVRFPFHRQP